MSPAKVPRTMSGMPLEDVDLDAIVSSYVGPAFITRAAVCRAWKRRERERRPRSETLLENIFMRDALAVYPRDVPLDRLLRTAGRVAEVGLMLSLADSLIASGANPFDKKRLLIEALVGAGAGGRLDTLRALKDWKSQHAGMDLCGYEYERMLNAAAKYDNVDVFRWAMEWDEPEVDTSVHWREAALIAVRHQSEEVMRYCMREGNVDRHQMIVHAGEIGSRPALEFLHGVCGLTEVAVSAALRAGHVDIAKWLMQIGCPVHPEWISADAGRGADAGLLTWMRDDGRVQWDAEEMMQVAIRCANESVMDWLVA